MGRPRKNPLPRGIAVRVLPSGRVLYRVSFTDQHGKRRRENVGGSLDEAVARMRQREGEVAAGTYGATPRTIAEYARAWCEQRAAQGKRAADRETQLLRDHILPHLGEKRLEDLRPPHVAAWINALRTAGTMAPKSILNAHGVLSAMLAHARFEGLTLDNPARGLPKGILPKNEKRKITGAWTRAEMVRLISDERIPEPRRVLYAIAAFTGARLGEVCGMRWRDLDTTAPGLWRWSLRTQWDARPLKTEQPRDIPIHAELARILTTWRDAGWGRYTMRVRTADDFVVPRADGTMLSKNAAGAKPTQRHAALVGIEVGTRDFHSFRRGMITLARTDGADVHVLERVTHNAKGEMIDGYTYFGWEALCAAVASINLARDERTTVTNVVQLAANGEPAGGSRSGSRTRSGAKKAANSLEVPGVERGAVSAPRGIRRDSAGSHVASTSHESSRIPTNPPTESRVVSGEPDPLAAAAALLGMSPAQLREALARR